MKTCLYLLLLVLLFSFCARERSGELTILHTNDMHAQFTPVAATWLEREEKPLIGGMVALQYYIKTESTPNATLVLDAGDIMTGTPLSKIVVDSAKGGGFIKMMNHIGYDAMTLGNHEFDEGVDNLLMLIGLSNFDILSANAVYNDTLLAPRAFKIYKIAHLRVGVIGLLMEDLDQVVLGKHMQGVRIADAVSSSQKIVDKIDAKTDLIILLTHIGHKGDLQIADALDRIDIIIGGHSHTRVLQAQKRNGVLVVQAGSKTTNLGKLTVSVAGDTVNRYRYELIPTWVDSVKAPDAAMQKLVKKYEQKIQKAYGQVIGTVQESLVKRSHEESDLGNFITDVLRKQTATDFAVLNSGGIRKSLFAGPLTKLDVNEVLPFANYLITFECSGSQVLTLIRNNARAMIDHSYGILQVSGLGFTYRKGADGSVEIVSATIGGKPVDPKARYTGATVDFVMGHAENYFNFVPQSAYETGYLISDLVINYIIENPHVSRPENQRMIGL